MNKALRQCLGRLSCRFSKHRERKLHRQKSSNPSVYDSFESVQYEEIDHFPRHDDIPAQKLDIETWNRITGNKETNPRRTRRFPWFSQFSRKTPVEIRTDKEILEEQQQLELCRFQEQSLLKPRGYHCARNRPLTCICTCDAQFRPEPVLEATPGENLPPPSTWDASWVFFGDDEQQMQKAVAQSNDRIRKMLEDKSGCCRMVADKGRSFAKDNYFKPDV